MTRWFRRMRFWVRMRRMRDDLRQEIETHRSLREDALARTGAEDATAASRRALGNVTLACEEARDVWIWPWLDSAGRDVRYALRALGRQRGFAIASVLTIGVGTGALASVLSVVHAVLLRPPPYPTADRIVQIEQVINGRAATEVSAVDVLALRDGCPSLSHVTIAWFSEVSVTGGGLPDRARRVYTDSQAFALLGIQPLIGRLPTVRDEAPDAESVVVIGHRLWLERFESDGGVLGRTIRVDGQEHVIIAVMPPDFRFPAPYWAAGDLWLLRPPAHRSWPDTRGRVMLAFGLLRDGRTIARAQAEADAVAAALDARYPDAKRRIGLRLTTWAEAVRAEAQPRLLLVLGGAVMVFLIVCANVANLLISRGVDRQRELAARVALGAGRPRLIRQVLTETGVLFAIGGGVGVLAAIWGSRLIASMQGIPRMDEATIDAPVAASAMATTLVAAAIVGLVPALQAARAGASDLAAFGSRSVSHPKRWRRVQRALVAAEIGLALVLLSGAGALLEGAREQARVDPGFEVDGLLQARIALPPDKYASPGAQVAFYSRVIDVLRGAPDVVAAGLVDVPPGVGGRGGPSVLVDGDPAPASVRDLRRADVRVVSAGYLETLGLAPRFGRFFSSADSPAVPVAIVNEAFVRQHLDDRPAVGRGIRVVIGGIDGLDRMRTIVGVVPDLREKTLYEPTPPTVYVPLTQAESTRTALLRMAVVVRSTRPTADLVTLVRAAIAEVDPDQAAFGFMTMRDRMEEELSLNRLNLALLGVLSTVSLFLAVVGVYGVTAHAVRQRTREIGIRLALGETPGGVQRLLLGESSALLVGGFAVGGIAAVFGTALLRSLVFGIDETSAGTFVGAGIVLAAAVLAGGLVPMRRAARVDPASVLRWE